MPEFIETEFESGVGRMILNRPDKRNALNREMLAQICGAVEQFNSRKELRVLVVQAVGSVFCAGMDLAQMQDRATNPNRDEAWHSDAESYHKVLLALLDCQVPTIAAIPGAAIAGGVGLALACDIVIAADSSFFSLPEPRRGITAAMVTPLLLRRTSHARAAYVLLSGKRIPAEQALAIGLCDEVVPQSETEPALRAMLQSVLEGSPRALATTKQFLGSLANTDIRQALNRAVGISADARASVDAREGLAAFLEKRRPAWAPEGHTP